MTDETKKLVIAAKQIFSGESGKIMLDYFSDFCFEHKNTWIEGKPDVQNVRNGRRDVILKIRWFMAIDPEAPEPPKEPEQKYI